MRINEISHLNILYDANKLSFSLGPKADARVEFIGATVEGIIGTTGITFMIETAHTCATPGPCIGKLSPSRFRPQ